ARFPGQVFMDVSVLDPGVDFVQAIDDEVGSCDAFVVVIGKGWLSITNASGQRRLDDAQDFVRLEIATALKRKIAVVPALVGGATMPTDRLRQIYRLISKANPTQRSLPNRSRLGRRCQPAGSGIGADDSRSTETKAER